VNSPRQNGKGEILMARELYGLYELGERFIVHSAHEWKTSERHFQRLERTIRACPELLASVKRTPTGRIVGFRLSHGDEAIELDDGRRIEFRTRTKQGMRGFDDVSLLVLDEAMVISQAAHGSMIPTLRASTAVRGPQLWYAGSAVDQERDDHGVVWARVRERGIEGTDEALAYFEWSLDFEDPARVPEEVVEDQDAWRRVNFAIGRGRIPVEHMEREFRVLGRRAFVVELLGVGDYPDTSESGLTVIDMERWALLEDGRSRMPDPVCLAFDVSPDRQTASIAAAGRRDDELMHVEVIDHRAGTGWVVKRLRELYERHYPQTIVCDGKSPAASLLRELDEAGVVVETLSASEHAQACGMLFDLVGQERLRHLGQPELDAALRGAATRPLSEAWAWRRRDSSADICPLVAVTLAVFPAMSTSASGELMVAAA
jgi:hypothetical protein